MTILGIFSWVAIGKEMNKLSNVSDSLGKVAGGNLTIADLPVTAADEIGELSQSLNEMKNNRGALFVFVTKIYPNLLNFLIKNGFQENVDFMDGTLLIDL